MAEPNLNAPTIACVADGGFLEAGSARDLLFNEILEQLKICDLFSNPAHTPTIFPVYAHNNNNAIGVAAHEDYVGSLISWLKEIKARILSDKSPLHRLTSKEDDPSAIHNILANQIRLLPPSRGSSANSEESSTSIDKVIVCGSAVLQGYCDTSYAKSYIDKIVQACKDDGGQSDLSPKAPIRKAVHQEVKKTDFHHVLTELAFLKFRKAHYAKEHDMVPVSLNGDHSMSYLSLFDSTDLTLVLKSDTIPALHQLFFKLLVQLFVEEGDLVNECKKCYDEVVKELKLEKVERLTKTEFHDCLHPKINRMYRNYWGVFSTAIRNGKNVAYVGMSSMCNFQVLIEETKVKERQEILEWLSPISTAQMHGVYLDRRTKRLDGTCNWVIQEKAFKTWHLSDQSGILCLHGGMGTGKTYATSRVVDWITSSLEANPDYEEAFAYFYCIKNDEMRDKPTKILRSIVRQIAAGPWNRGKKNIKLHEAIIEVWQKHKDHRLHNIFDDWEKCILKLVDKYSRTTIVLDALDECDEDDRAILVDLFEKLVARSSHIGIVKIFVATRPEADLKNLLRHYTIPMQEGHISRDIAAFLVAKTADAKRWSSLTHEFKKHITDTLLKRSQDMFLFARLQIDRLLKHTLEKEIQADLEELPRNLNEAYKAIYENSMDTPTKKALASRALRWVMCAARPLTSDELLFAICQDPETDAMQVPRLDENFLLESCQNLLRLDTSLDNPRELLPVWRLAHQAVAEFLKKKDDFHSSLAHYEAGMICLDLLRDTFDGDFACSQSGSSHDLETAKDLKDDPRWGKGHMCPCMRDRSPETVSKMRRGDEDHQSLEKALVEYAVFAWPTHVRAHEHSGASILHLLRVSQNLQKFLGKPNRGSLIFERWYDHMVCQPEAVNPPQWSIFYERRLHAIFYKHNETEVTPIVLACYLGFYTTLAEWWYSPSLNYNACFSSETWTYMSQLEDKVMSWSLVAVACVNDEVGILRCLLDRGAEVNTQRDDEIPAILTAAENNSTKAARQLIEHGAELRSPCTNRYGSVLEWAIRNSSLEFMDLLMVQSLQSPLTSQPLRQQMTKESLTAKSLENLLIAEGLHDLPKDQPLHDPSKDQPLPDRLMVQSLHDLAIVKSRHDQLVVQSPRDLAMFDSLHDLLEMEKVLSCLSYNDFKSKQAFLILLHSHVDVNLPLSDATLLAAAAYHGWEDLVGRLLDDGADINANCEGTQDGFPFSNALEAALVDPKHVSIARLLFRRGARISGKNIASVLRRAGNSTRNDEIRELLQGHEVNDTWRVWDKKTPWVSFSTSPLIEAVRLGDLDDVQTLIEFKPDVNLRVQGNADALSTAFEQTLEKERYPGDQIIKSLIDAGASMENLEGERLNTALAAAAFAGWEDKVELFLKRGASRDEICGHKFTTAIAAAAASKSSQRRVILRNLLGNCSEFLDFDAILRDHLADLEVHREVRRQNDRSQDFKMQLEMLEQQDLHRRKMFRQKQ